MKVWAPYASLDEALTRLGPLPAGIDLDVVGDDHVPATGADTVALLAVPNYSAKQVLALAFARPLPGLRWVQLASAGYEHVLDVIPDSIGICNAAGVHDAGTSELAVALALAALRRLDTYALDKAAGRFAPVYSDSLADKRVLIVGYGRIGSAVERRLAGFEVASVTRVARTPRSDPAVHAVADLPELVGAADVIFLCLPGSPATRHIVDAGLLARMHDGTLLVNVGRGVLVDTAALLAENGRIRAALDVTDPEPLPDGHPLWTADFVTWAPHVGGLSRAFEPRYDALLRAQLARFVDAQPLLNIVRSPR
ncbi:MAG: dihydrofolate reductase [Propionibacteriaceae bacterium]|jgi:phosphoglycerate dehydrogenase-like enzyme|nr:dihydrofolate reductase [Propionibacteriaceae bacterium]